MSEFQSFLAVPIKACISSSGVFLSADPPVWRLHNLAGGGDDSTIAIPALAALAESALRTRMRVFDPTDKPPPPHAAQCHQSHTGSA